MAPLPVINQTFRCVFKWTDGGGQSAVNVIHVATDDPGKSPGDVFATLNRAVSAAMWSSIGAGAVIGAVDITPLDGVTATQEFSTGSGPKWGGAGIGQFIPAGACLVKLTTGKRGRSFRGRVYIPFLSEAGQGNGEVDSDTVAAMQPAWTGFLSNLQSDSTTPMALMVASYKHAEATVVEVATVETPVATQRRRQGRLRAA